MPCKKLRNSYQWFRQHGYPANYALDMARAELWLGDKTAYQSEEILFLWNEDHNPDTPCMDSRQLERVADGYLVIRICSLISRTILTFDENGYPQEATTWTAEESLGGIELDCRPCEHHKNGTPHGCCERRITEAKLACQYMARMGEL